MPSLSPSSRGRLRAASLRCNALIGIILSLPACTQGGGTTPMADTVSMMWGDSPADMADYARQVPYASLALSMDGNDALVVMAYQSGGTGERTLWQARDQATLELRHGVPFASAGFDNELLGIDYSTPSSADNLLDAHALTVQWRDADGQQHVDSAQIQTQCEPAALLQLPLVTRSLEACHQRVDWLHAGTSDNTLWRDPVTRRIWAGDIEPWPDAQRIAWQVARPWWPQN